MTVWGVAMVRDEADIIEQTVSRMLKQVDHVLIADNGSTDGTREILERLDVDLVDDPDPAYYQSQKMSRLAAKAAAEGAEWIVPFDADEVWYSPFGRIADVLSGRPECTAPAAVYDHVPTGFDVDALPVDRMGWRRSEPCPLAKVACRPVLPVTIEQGNHAATYPAPDVLGGQLVVRHFPYRSVEQMIRKARNGAAAYAATDLPEYQGKHWRDYGRLTDEQIGDVFRRWFWSADPTRDPDLLFDPCPV